MFKIEEKLKEIGIISREIKTEHSYFSEVVIDGDKGRFMIKELGIIIDKYGLAAKKRTSDLTMKRYFLYQFAYRKLNITLSDIGAMVNKDHSSVLHGIKQHDDLIEFKDLKYLALTQDIKEDIDSRNMERRALESFSVNSKETLKGFKLDQLGKLEKLESVINDLKLLYTE